MFKAIDRVDGLFRVSMLFRARRLGGLLRLGCLGLWDKCALGFRASVQVGAPESWSSCRPAQTAVEHSAVALHVSNRSTRRPTLGSSPSPGAGRCTRADRSGNRCKSSLPRAGHPCPSRNSGCTLPRCRRSATPLAGNAGHDPQAVALLVDLVGGLGVAVAAADASQLFVG